MIFRRDMTGRLTGDHPAFEGEMLAYGLTPRSDTEVSRQVPPPLIARLLDLDADQETIVRTRRMYADDQPIQLATSWLPAGIAAGTRIEQPDSGPGGIYARLAELGHAPAEFEEITMARFPYLEEVSFLGLVPGEHVLDIRRTAFTAQGRPVEVCEAILASSRHELYLRWPAK